MKQIWFLMGMPCVLEVAEDSVTKENFQKIYDYLVYVDGKFSIYKRVSEISKINRGEIEPSAYSADMKKVLLLCEKTRRETNGYFDIRRKGKLDPSGLVKGWAIYNACLMLKAEGFANFCMEIAGDIQISGKNPKGQKWKIGIRNPFEGNEIVKTVSLTNRGIATSGTYERANHIWFPKNGSGSKVVGLTVIGKNVYEADRFATAAFAMGDEGIKFIENLPGMEGYMIDKEGMATMTSGFEKYVEE